MKYGAELPLHYDSVGPVRARGSLRATNDDSMAETVKGKPDWVGIAVSLQRL